MNRFNTFALLATLTASPAAADMNSTNVGNDPSLTSVTSFQVNRPTGVAVSPEGRVFVNFPYAGYSDARHTAAVVELVEGGMTRTLFPETWNDKSRASDSRFVNIQSLTFDETGRLWLLDTGSPRRAGVVEGGAKLIEVDVANDRVVRTIPFSPQIVSGNDYLNDVRVSARDGTAYVTDSVSGGIIVVDLETTDQRMVLTSHLYLDAYGPRAPTVERTSLADANGSVRAPATDGIALSPDHDTLYYMYRPLAGSSSVLSVPTQDLRNTALSASDLEARVSLYAEGVISDGIEMSPDGRLHLTDIERNAVSRIEADKSITVVVQDDRLSWPDAIAFAPDGDVLVTEAQFHRLPFFNDGFDASLPPFDVWRYTANDAVVTSDVYDGTAYSVAGNGPETIVLMHGLGADQSVWHEIMPDLARDYRVVAFDFTGFGRSSRAVDLNPDRLVAQSENLMAHLGIKTATLVGNSMGGWIALRFANVYPDRVNAVIAVAPAFYRGLPDGVSAQMLSTAAAPQTMPEMQRYLSRVLARDLESASDISAILQRHRWANAGDAIPDLAKHIAAKTHALSPADLDALISPTLILQGTEDGIVAPSSSRNLASMLPNGSFQLIEGSGHWPQVEHPAEFTRYLREWLARLP